MMLSPREVDEHLEVGIDEVIDLFLDLELDGLLTWNSLNLTELELERSTKDIYQEVYNSSAQLTKEGQLFMDDYKLPKERA